MMTSAGSVSICEPSPSARGGAMEAATPVQSLHAEAKCPICLGYYQDPVMTECGHSFWRPCVARCARTAGTPFPCPQCRATCRRRNLRPNWQLANIVQISRQLSAPAGSLCGRHGERLRLFCDEDHTLLCVVCRESQEHRFHAAYPIDEAAQRHKVKLEGWLWHLQKELKRTAQLKKEEGEKCNHIKGVLAAEKQSIVAQYEKLHKLLEEGEQTVIRRLEEMEEKIAGIERETMEHMSNLGRLIAEIQGSCQMPAQELLRVARTSGRPGGVASPWE
ncbi:E3 ubiquitin-protein ligase TRIM39-like isoform X2 [Ambystoma mexicanum]|uniref:E3 ubiquitin-protein ligase TRIM39-like isoform X2 n=1 Tax=Ambystoma mexicanum TaxID=8296 RepID=UPI0037E8CEE0